LKVDYENAEKSLRIFKKKKNTNLIDDFSYVIDIHNNQIRQ